MWRAQGALEQGENYEGKRFKLAGEKLTSEFEKMGIVFGNNQDGPGITTTSEIALGKQSVQCAVI